MVIVDRSQVDVASATVPTPAAHGAIVFDDSRPSDSPLIERVWSSHSERSGAFTSVSSNHWEMVFTSLAGEKLLTLRGPETTPTAAWCPPDGQWLAIRFRLGTFLRGVGNARLMNRQDISIPLTSRNAFDLAGSRFEMPDFDTAEALVDSMAKAGIIVRDSAVFDALQCDDASLSIRSLQRHFAAATGLTLGMARQIERARRAALLLREGKSIADVAQTTGYFDHAHLTRSVKRFIGLTPSAIARGTGGQLSLLYKT